MRTGRLTRLALALLLFVVSGGQRLATAQEDVHPRNAAPVTLLQINDVYSTVPVDGLGGLARVATIKRQIAASGSTPLLMLAGDFLSTSVASTVFKGEQMIAALNAAGLDVATLGNHEFDFGIDILIKRMAEARWQWVVANVIDRQTGKPVGGAAPYVIRTFGSLRVGILGLCLTTEGMPRDRLERIQLIDPMEAAATYVPMMRSERADVIVALTHLSYAEDRALVERFSDIDVVIGGHEHFPITATVGRTLISKAGSDAKFVARIDLRRRESEPVEHFFELMPVTSAIPEDPTAADVINGWETRLGAEIDRTVGTTRVELDGVTARVRTSETNLGNLLADAVRAEAGADIAIVNGGGIRTDRVYPPGPLTHRMLLAIHPFGNIVCKIEVPGRVVLQALNYGVSKLPGLAGQFPQVSGMTFRVDTAASAGERVRDVEVNGIALDENKTYTLALPDFILNGGDGYTMFGNHPVLISPENGEPMEAALEKYVSARAQVAPAVEGRIAISP